jgi:hypothetical protein
VAGVAVTLLGCGGNTELYTDQPVPGVTLEGGIDQGAAGTGNEDSSISSDARPDRQDAAPDAVADTTGKPDTEGGVKPDADGGPVADAGCPPGTTPCGLLCVALANDPSNCGACGVVCGAGKVCNAGQCATSCGPSLTDCSGACVSLQQDPQNCGACGKVCNLPQAVAGCSAGACTVAACATGFANCNGAPADGCEVALASDPKNCGACGASCGAGKVCNAGQCALVCQPPLADCSGACVSLQTDPLNCGACGKSCILPHAVAGCGAGACTVAACATGFADCNGAPADGCEAALASDPANCGACAKACPKDYVCTAGKCELSCAPNLTDCGGACVNLKTDPANCGACKNACSLANAAAGCADGLCTVAACFAGFADCDTIASNGCETNVASDPVNCGGCGKTCKLPNATAACASGLCAVAACSSGFADCDSTAGNGCETNVSSDPANCGACGKICSLPNAVAACASGLCAVASCKTGFGDCDKTAANGCEADFATDPKNCGGCGTICAPTEVCTAGTCGPPPCQPPLTDCGGACVDLKTDPAHCGACARPCSSSNVASKSCAGGLCASSCQLGWGNCSQPAAPAPDDGCERDVSANNSSCGSCSNNCTAQGGAGGLVCDGASRPKNACGCASSAACLSSGSGSGAGCDTTTGLCSCAGATCRPGEACRAMMGNTMCTCNNGPPCGSGQTCCQSPAGCKDLSNDPTSCGACGRACPLQFTCTGGACACTFSSACNGGSPGTCSNGVCVCGAVTCQPGQRCLPGGVCG